MVLTNKAVALWCVTGLCVLLSLAILAAHKLIPSAPPLHSCADLVGAMAVQGYWEPPLPAHAGSPLERRRMEEDAARRFPALRYRVMRETPACVVSVVQANLALATALALVARLQAATPEDDYWPEVDADASREDDAEAQ